MATVHTEFIGRYRVVGTLGQGAMGRVYLADDPGMGMKVAIKFIKRDNMLENEVILARFRREAALGARIQHPNIVQIHDVGQDAVHGPYMVMEYVDGRELIEILREGTATIAERLGWLGQIARALRCAHESGVVHRDVKPANILVGRDGQAKLIDFGVAKVMGAQLSVSPSATVQANGPGEEAEVLADEHATAWGMLSAEGARDTDEPHLEIISSHGPQSGGGASPLGSGARSSSGLTELGALIGTPSYTAPELLQGDSPSPQTDDWAFAVTAFQSLLGHLPFRGRTTRETLENVRDGALEFLGTPGAKLRLVFERAFSKDPIHRYADLDGFMLDLYSACNLEPEPPASPRLQSHSQRTRSSASLPALSARQRFLPSLSLLKWAGVTAGFMLLLALVFRWWLTLGGGLDEITVHTEPSGASIYVDGTYLGQTPLDKITLSQSGRRMMVMKKHFKTIEQSLTLEDAFVSLVLELAPYDLKVETEPPGADILLDGKPAGSSPAMLKRVLGKGDHSLELRLNGFAPKVIKLDPLRPPGSIQLDPEPSPSPSER